MNTVRYEYETPLKPTIFAPMMDNIFGTDGLDDVDRHLYSSSEFNLMEYHDMLNADDINNDFLDYASVQNVLTDFSPSDINLELLTGELLPPETYESQQENSTRQQQQNHGNGEPSLLDADLFSPDFLDMLDFDSRRQFTKDPLFYKTYPSQRSNDNDELNQKTDFYNDCKPSTSNEQPYYQQQEQKQQQQRDEFNPYLGPIYDDVTKSELADFRDMEAKFAFDDILLGSSGSTKTKHDIAGERMTEEDEDLGDVDEDENADDALASDTDDDDDENAENKAPATAGAQQKQPQRRRDDTRKDYAKRIEEPQMAGGYVKPSYSYSCLITLALKNSGNGELTVSEIYAFLCEHFPYFRAAPSGWKNSVRHNLSLNKSFQKIEVETPGCHGRKSCLWRLNPNKVIKMEQELRKWRDRSEALILSAMHNSSAANLDAIQSGQMGMPATVQRRASVNNLLVSRLNSSSSGYPTSMMSLPYADSMQKCSVGKNFQPRVMGQSLPAGSSLNSMSTSHQQLVQHQPKMLQRVMAANASGIGCDIDELDGTSTTSSSSASCSPSVSRRQSSPMTSRMRLDSLGAENGENYGVNDTTNGTNKEGGSAESLHKAAARKLDFLLQQKSATIFNPSKELFTSPNALTAVTSTPPNRRLLLNAAGTPTRSPLSTLSMNTESSALKSRRRCETPMSPSMKRLTSGTTVGYSVLINRQTTDLASKVGTIEHANEADVLETKRFRNAADASSHGSAVKLERQQQDLRSPYRVGFSSFGEFSDENSSPQQNKEQQFKQLQKQHQQQRNRDTVNGQLVGELNTRSPFRQLNNQNNNNQNKAGSTRSYQISSASLRLGEASNLSPSRKTLIKERRHYFGAMPQQIQQKRLPEQDLQQHEKQQHSYNQQRLEQQKQRQYDKQREVSDQYQLGENQNVSSADVRPTMETNGRTAVAKASVFHSAMDAIHKNRLF